MTKAKYKNTSEMLNAFVDGELPGVDSAALLRDLATKPDLAQEMSDLTRLKTAVQASYDDLPCREPDLDLLFSRHDRASRRGFGVFWSRLRDILGALTTLPPVAKGAMAVATVLVAATLTMWIARQGPTDSFVAEAIGAHHKWLEQTPKQPTNHGIAQLAAFHARNQNIYVPDLKASKLRIGWVAAFGNDGVHVGYVGTRDCHLSLFIQPTEKFSKLPLTLATVSENRVFRWRANRLDYALLAVGMDQGRLRLIAEDVFQATRLMQPFDRETQMALRLNRKQSQACGG